MHRHVMGKEGMVLAAIASLAMFFVAHFVATMPALTGRMGVCLPSPNEWPIGELWGWIINLLLFWVVCLTLYLVNKEFSFVQGSDTVMTGMFVVMGASNLWISGALSASTLFALVNLLSLLILFGCYRKRNATQELFVVATLLSLGSMFQYAFIFMIPIYLISAIMMKCFNFKALIAFGMGIVAPYWIGLGLGILAPQDFMMPTFTNLFDGYADKGAIFVGLLNIGITALIGILLALTNLVKLYAGNTQRRLYNMVINLLGLGCVILIIVDSANMVTYLTTLYATVAIQLANHFALRNVPFGARWLTLLSLLYTASFILMLTT